MVLLFLSFELLFKMFPLPPYVIETPLPQRRSHPWLLRPSKPVTCLYLMTKKLQFPFICRAHLINLSLSHTLDYKFWGHRAKVEKWSLLLFFNAIWPLLCICLLHYSKAFAILCCSTKEGKQSFGLKAQLWSVGLFIHSFIFSSCIHLFS